MSNHPARMATSFATAFAPTAPNSILGQHSMHRDGYVQIGFVELKTTKTENREEDNFSDKNQNQN